MVGRLGVGLDNIDLADCERRGVAVHPATGANDAAVAEYVITTALMLLLAPRAAAQSKVQLDLQHRTLIRADLVFIFFELFLIVPFVVHGELSARSARQALEMILGGPYTAVFWVGVVAFGILVVLNRSNIHSPNQLIRFMQDQGIDQFKLNPIAFLGTARSDWDRLALDQEQILDYFQRLGRLLVDCEQDIYEANLMDMVRHLVSKQRQSRCLRGHCGAGDSFNAVAADGSIYPCGRATQSPGLKLGNILHEPHSLNRPGRHNLHIQRIRERRPKTLEDCVDCHYRELCQGGCSVQAFERYGTVQHKTPECTFNKSMYPHLMRWLTHQPEAVAYLNRSQYFGGERQLHIAHQDYLRA
mgnify:CR=1 FL=1